MLSQVEGDWLLVILGAGGDLTKRKLIPALYHLDHEGKLPSPERFVVLGVARTPSTDDEFRELIRTEYRQYMPESEQTLELNSPAMAAKAHDFWESFSRRFHYAAADFLTPEAPEKIREFIDARKKESREGKVNVVFYFATPPTLFGPTTTHFAKNGLADESEGYRRFIYEKPFGHDLESARALNAELRSVLKETQIYRIDHYLGKETVQNLLVFRFANGIFEPIWNRAAIESVHIRVDETLGVENRAGYYDKAGALRDMMPNHLFQLLTLIGMEPPSSFDADAVRDEKTKVLRAIRPIPVDRVGDCALRGQYGAGPGGVAYRDEPGVNPKSDTETYVALKLELENWRWAGVPFYLRTGKRLPERKTEIRIRFKPAPLELFRGLSEVCTRCNELVLSIQPEEKITLFMGAKVPGLEVRVGEVSMDFDYRTRFGESPSNGYETLIYDCLIGDATLFQRADQIEAAWSVVDPVLRSWAAHSADDFPNYRAGEKGPQ